MPGIVLIGAQWGDEGKGKATDLIGTKVDYVARFNGGNNAGHSVVVGDESYALHLLPSGIFRKGVVNILGNGVALDCESLWTEMSDVMDQGVAITPENLKISDRASLLLPWHRTWTPWRRPAWRTRSTAPPSRASPRSIRTSTRRRPSWPASCCTRKSSGTIWRAFWSGRT